MIESGRIFHQVLDRKTEMALLEAKREVLSKLGKDSLGGFCGNVSNFVANRTGLGLAGGMFTLDEINVQGEREAASHFWNIDGLGRIIDITIVQFNSRLREPVSGDVLVINPQDPLYRRYIQRRIVAEKNLSGDVVLKIEK